MTAVRGAFSYLLAPGFRKIFFDSWKARPEEYAKIFNVNSSTRAYEEDFPMSGFGGFVDLTEGGAITYTDAQQGVQKRYTPTQFGLGFRVHRGH